MKLSKLLEIDTDDVLESRKTDSSGRVALGLDYTDFEVDVVVIDSRDKDDTNDTTNLT